MAKIGFEAVADMAQFERGMAQFNKSLTDAQADTDSATKSMSGGFSVVGGAAAEFLGNVATKALTALAGAAKKTAQYIYDAGEQMDSAFDSIAIKTGATGKAMEDLQATTRKVFTSVPTDMQKASDVVAELSRSMGLTGKASEELSKRLLESSRMMGGDAATNAKTLSRVIEGWGMKTEDAAGVLDKLFVASQKSGVGMDQLMQSVKTNGVQMRGMGYSLEESIAMFAKWEREGLNSQQMVMSLRMATANFAQEAGKAGKGGVADFSSAITEQAFKLEQAKLKLQEYQGKKTQTESQTRALVHTIEKEQAALDKLNTAQMNADKSTTATASSQRSMRDRLMEAVESISSAKTETEALTIGMKLFGTRGQQMVEAIRAGQFSADDFAAALVNTKDAIMATSAATQDWPEKWAVAKNKIQDALAPIGLGIMDIAGKLLEKAMPAFDTLQVFITGTITPALTAFGERIGTVIDALGPLSEIIKGAFAGEGVNVKWLSEVLGTMGLAPRIAAKVSGAFSTLTDIFGSFKQNIQDLGAVDGIINGIWDTLNRFFGDNSAIGNLVGNFLFGIVDAVGKLKSGDILGALKTVFDSIDWAQIGIWVKEGWGKVTNLAADLSEKVKDWIDSQKWIQAAKDKIGSITWSDIGTWIADGWAKVTDVAQKLVDRMREWVDSNKWLQAIKDKIAGIDWQGISNSLSDLFGKAIDGLASFYDLYVDKIQEWIKKISEGGTRKAASDSKILQTIVTALGNLITNSMQSLSENADSMAEDFARLLGAILRGAVILVVKGLTELGKLIWKGITSSLKEGGESEDTRVTTASMADAFMNGFIEGLFGIKSKDDIDKAIADFWDSLGKSIVTWAGSAATSIEQAAASVVDGILNGLKSEWGKVETWWKDSINSLPAWMKKLLGISSPSKVFYELGFDMMLGLAEGLDEGKRNVIIAMGNVVQALVDAFAGLTQVGASTGMLNLSRIRQVVKEMVTAIGDISQTISDAFRPATLSADTLNHAKDVASQISAVMSVFKDAFDSFAALTDYVPGAGNARAMMKELAVFIPEMVTALVDAVNALTTTDLAATGVANAAAFAESIVAILQIVQPALDALAGLADYKILSAFGDRATSFVHRIGEMIEAFVVAAKDLDTTRYDNARLFADAVGGIVGAVKPALDALYALADYKILSAFGDKATSFVHRIGELMEAFVVAANGLDMTRYDAAKLFAAAVQGIVGTVKPAIDALVALATYKPVKELPDAIDNWSLDLQDLLDELVFVAGRFDADGISAASAFGQAVSGMVGFIAPSIDALVALAKYKAVKGLLFAIYNWSLDLQDLIDELLFVAEQFKDKGTGAAATFSVNVTAMVGMIKPAIDALTALLTWKPVYNITQVALNFRIQLHELLNQIIILSRHYAKNAISAAATFATNVTAMVNAVKPAVEALTALVSYKPVRNIAKVALTFRRQLHDVIDQLIILSRHYAANTIAAAKDFWTAVETMVGFIKPAIEAIAAILAYKPGGKPLTDKLKVFGDDIEAVLQKLIEVAGRMETIGINAAGRFEEASKNIVADIKHGLGYFNPDAGGLLAWWGDAWAKVVPPVDAATAALYRFIEAFHLLPTRLPWQSFAQLAPTSYVPVQTGYAGATGGGSTTNVSVNLGPFTVSNEMDLARVRQVIRQEISNAVGK